MKRVYISNGSLEAMAQCGTKHLLSKRRYASSEESTALVCGGAVHVLLEEWLLRGSIEDAVMAFENEYRVYSEANVPADNARDWKNVIGIMRQYMTTRGPGQVPYEALVEVEQGYAMPLAQFGDWDVWYYTRPDRLVRRDGKLHTFDTKTTGWLDRNWAKQWEASTQITGQVVCVEAARGEPVYGAFIDGIELKTLNSSTKRCARHGVPYHECALLHVNFQYVLTERGVDARVAWHVETVSLVGQIIGLNEAVAKHGIKSADVRGIYTGTCTKYGSFCPYWDFCITGRQEDMLEQLFTVREFDLLKQGKIIGPGGEVVEFEGGL